MNMYKTKDRMMRYFLLPEKVVMLMCVIVTKSRDKVMGIGGISLSAGELCHKAVSRGAVSDISEKPLH